MAMASIILKPGREKPLLRHHPWIFSGAIDKIEETPKPGETVQILSHDKKRLGCGAYSPHSQIMVRMWSFDSEEEISRDFFRSRLDQAIKLRKVLFQKKEVTGFRLVNAESDGIPGLIVDRYEKFLVCQFLATGAEHWKQDIVSILEELISPQGIYERSDADVRKKEGLPQVKGVLTGKEPPDLVEIQEGMCRFYVDVKNGHKTGFYLDQRDNRAILAKYAQGKEVLNCFSYTGGFGIVALKSGAEKVINIDSSASALGIAEKNLELNNLDPSRSQLIEGDVFTLLRGCRDKSIKFDIIVLDPPKFVASKGQIERASRGYKDLNLLAFTLLKPGGLLFTFSCSGLLETDLFQKIVADAALDAKRDAQIVLRMSQASDHPVALNFPEASYLKGLICRVL
jgi:23S rRNA (cytosine1962-C5)-methyltransferase